MASKNTKKDQEMAARLKKEGVKRESARCPICGKVTSLKEYYGHVALHPG